MAKNAVKEKEIGEIKMENTKHKHKDVVIKKIDGELVVTSRQVAEDFDKRHSDVTEIIRKLTTENSAVKNMMIESKFEHRGNEYTEYLLTRDGFSLLVMGFTGSKALEWKIKYIEAFNKMEEAIKGQAKRLSTEEMLELQFRYAKEVKEEVSELKEDFKDLRDNLPLLGVDCDEITGLIKKVCTNVTGYETPAYKDKSLRGRVYQDIYGQVKREFQVKSYKAIKRSQIELAKEIIRSYKAPTALLDEIIKVNNQIDFKEVI